MKKKENTKGAFYFIGLDKKKYRLTLQEKSFCISYLEFHGNGTEAAWQHFKCKNKNVAAAIASEYLRKPNVFAFIDLKLEEYGYNDENVKKQHLFIINQMADLAAKNKALDMYYKLKGEYAPEQREHFFPEPILGKKYKPKNAVQRGNSDKENRKAK